MTDLWSYRHMVIENVISPEEADRHLRTVWDFIQSVEPAIKRHKPSTYMSRKPDLWPAAQADMFQVDEAGWLLGELRETIATLIFEPLYGTPRLHVSKDAFTFVRPTADRQRRPLDHFDQSGASSGLQCIQGSIALTDQDPAGDACFQCWPGSHRHHAELTRGHVDRDFVPLNDPMKLTLAGHGIQSLRVPVRRGTVILWRSDLAHCGAPPLGQRDSFRCVAYVCCLPAALTPPHVHEQKAEAYATLRTGSHWPDREVWFEGRGRRDVRPYFKPRGGRIEVHMTPRLRQLYGLDPYDSDDESVPAAV